MYQCPNNTQLLKTQIVSVHTSFTSAALEKLIVQFSTAVATSLLLHTKKSWLDWTK